MAVVKGMGLWSCTCTPQTAVVMLAHPPLILWRPYTPAWTCPPVVSRRMVLTEVLRLRVCSFSPAWTAAGVDGYSSERPGVSASGAIIDDDEGTEVGSPSGGPRKLRTSEGCVLLPVLNPTLRKFLPPEEAEVRRLSQLRADELADHLGELALRQAPLVSPRLEAVLSQGARGLRS